jgi:hypothetical protein
MEKMMQQKKMFSWTVWKHSLSVSGVNSKSNYHKEDASKARRDAEFRCYNITQFGCISWKIATTTNAAIPMVL